ncbi:uncharacterized protein LOC116429051 [Nomia melanderi]|uniref:uncharacterized protein LOC116429051 n=1 Tax=Nomia melanderi TaxID=2448451 RepID=UPI0013041435|nr:hyaluronan mediated motility receptor-like [Nomia melanderi]
MSFSKAKIQRFNEFGNDVPPPGAYDPKFDDKVKGLAIHKSERFHEKTITNAEHNLSLSNKSVNKAITGFKTPQPPQKNTLSKSCTKLRPRSILPSPDTKSHHNLERELADLQIECLNKDKTIQEYEKRTQDMQESIQEHVKRSQDMEDTIQEHVKRSQDMQETIQEHIKRSQDMEETIQGHVKRSQDMQECIQEHIKRSQDMQEKIQKLESQLEESRKSQADIEMQNKKDKETMMKLHQEALDKHIERHKSELEHLLEKIMKLEFELTSQKHISEDKIQSLEKQNEENVLALNEANTKIEELTDTIRIMEEKKSDTKENTELLEQEKVRREALEEEVRKLLEYIERLKKDYEEISEKYAELIGHQNHRQRIKHVSQLKDKINQLEEDLRLKVKKIEQQRQIIEKMNPERKRILNKFKENFLKMKEESTTPESSPMKPLTPLRIIND